MPPTPWEAHATADLGTELATDPAASQEWQRLSLRMLLIHPVRALRDLLPVLLPAFFISANNRTDDVWGTRLQIAGGVLVLLMAFGRWALTSYRVSGDQVQLREGLLNRKLHTVRVDRVRSVDTTSSLLHRVLGLTSLKLGTAADTEHPLVLDGLDNGAAERLRVALLHRRAELASKPGAAAEPGEADETAATAGAAGVDGSQASAAPAEPDVQTELARFDPAWLSYAPLGTVGVVAGLALLGLIAQFGQYVDSAGEFIDAAATAAQDLPLVIVAGMALVFTLLVVAALAIASTASAWWGLRVVRHSAGVIRITRGLFTTRSVSLDVSRVRGVRIVDTVLLRPAKAATLTVLSTGLNGGTESAAMLPAAPVPVVTRVAGDVLETPVPLATPLVAHGPGAQRRRWTRAIWLPLLILAEGLLAYRFGGPLWLAVVSALPLLSIPWLAKGRYAALGHAVSDTAAGRHLVTRHGYINRQTIVLDTTGVVGWTVRESFWQRRAGVATVLAATSAGARQVPVIDIPVESARPVIEAATPGMLDPF